MRHLETEVLVIGGGATGTGVVRDLAMRGFKCILVERRDLAHGTTGRYHGLLHSGGRYVVKDPLAARECIEENRILRRIMPQCIEDTGGFFVLTSQDDPAYAPQFIEGCHKAGIPVETVPIRQMLKEEPLLNPQITQCYRLPDGSADSFLAADLNALSARQYGAEILTYHEVIHLLRNQGGEKGSPCIGGALCQDLVKDEQIQISADIVINASGAWAGKIGATVGVNIHMVPGKGTMIALNHRVVNTVINRCKMPSDGDILVPAHTVVVIGTTDIKVSDPDHFGIELWEIRLMLEEGEKLIPGFKSLRMLRAWAGVRPLFLEQAVGSSQETTAPQNRDVSRAFSLLDHSERDGIPGLITITGGKWTTYRKMAEVTVDKVCEKLDTQRQCRTNIETLPLPDGSKESRSPSYHALGTRLKNIEDDKTYGRLVCECELATLEDVQRSILKDDVHTIDDIRRDIRLGMGPCQGGFCSYRAAGIWHNLRHPPITDTNVALRDFLQERWKGLLPTLWGQQLRQERLNELIYLDVLNADHLPGFISSRLGPDHYSPMVEQARILPSGNNPPPPVGHKGNLSVEQNHPVSSREIIDTLVIGAGLAGLVAGWSSAATGKKTRVISKGWGATHWGSGCIDVLGYDPLDNKPVDSPILSLNRLLTQHPQHPYCLVGIDGIEEGLKAFQSLCLEAGYTLHGSLERNWLLPTALGTLRPTCIAPEMMVGGDAHLHTPMIIVGFEQFRDFYPLLVAENLNAQGILANDVTLDLASLEICRLSTGITLARSFDTPQFREEVALALKPRLGRAERVGFPAVLGLNHPLEAKKHLESLLGVPIFEIPGLPPSIPGIRLHNILLAAIQRYGGQVFDGMQVVEADISNGRIVQVKSEAAVRYKSHPARNFILATGGFLGGGFTVHESGYAQEPILNLPLSTPQNRNTWFNDKFLSPSGHHLFHTGVKVNKDFIPLDRDDQILFSNLFIVGSLLDAFDPLRERSMEGVALVTGFNVGKLL